MINEWMIYRFFVFIIMMLTSPARVVCLKAPASLQVARGVSQIEMIAKNVVDYIK